MAGKADVCLVVAANDVVNQPQVVVLATNHETIGASHTP